MKCEDELIIVDLNYVIDYCEVRLVYLYYRGMKVDLYCE